VSPELDDLLCSRYPKLFAERHNADLSMGRGFTCGDGWFQRVDQLCRDIQAAADNGEIRQPLARQVKEKWGKLRTYWRPYDDKIFELAVVAEDRSSEICGICGSAGEMVKPSRGWVRVRCEEHRDQSSEAASPWSPSTAPRPNVSANSAPPSATAAAMRSTA